MSKVIIIQFRGRLREVDAVLFRNYPENIRSGFFDEIALKRESRFTKLEEFDVPLLHAPRGGQTAPVVSVERIVRPVQEPKKLDGRFRHAPLNVPEEISSCCGINVFGRTIKSFVFTTDVVTMRNCNADAVLAVYPFTCQPAITQALLTAAECPVFTGVAGTTTSGRRSAELAHFSEMQGVSGVVLNSTAGPETIRAVAAAVDVPVVVTTTDFDEYAQVRIASGAQVVNVAAGRDTAEVVRQVRDAFPSIAIMASGGPSESSIRATIDAGADAITWTPPSMAELERNLMSSNRASLVSEEDAEGGQSA